MTEPVPESGVRASDVERHDLVEVLQRHYAAGRLTLAELEERVTAAYAARTRDQLAALVGDLPTDPTAAPTTDTAPTVDTVDPGLLCAMWFLCPPAALAYSLYNRRARRRQLARAPR